ncbi:MAG: mRNA surveillance protein pelota [Thermoproteota archaeon]
MKLLSFDEKRGIATHIPSVPEDLWELYSIIDEGDLLIAKTRRVIKVGTEDSTSKTKVLVEMGIRVERSWLDIFSGALNVTGKVEICPEDLDGTKAHYHTITIKVDVPLTIIKERWTSLHKKRIMESRKLKGHAALIVAMDYDEATVAKVTNNGIVDMREISHAPLSKRDRIAKEEEIKKFFGNVTEIVELFSTTGNERIILVGPGFAKEKLMGYLKDNFPNLFQRVVYTGGATSGTPSAIDEVLRSDNIKNEIKDLRLLEEVEYVEEFFKSLGQESKLVCYGIEDVERALSLGAVSKLLIHEHLPSFLGMSGTVKVDNLLDVADKKRCEVFFISSRHEGGRKLKSIGGLAAFLRYPLE